MEPISLQFLPDHNNAVNVIRYSGRAYASPPDHVMKWLFIPYFGAVWVLALVLPGYVGSLLPGSHMFALLIYLLASYYLWSKVVRNWRRAYFIERFNKLSPPRPTTVSADETGLRFEDEMSSSWLDWRLVRDAAIVPEGVFVTFGISGSIIPKTAFADEEQRGQFIDIVRANAGTAHIQRY